MLTVKRNVLVTGASSGIGRAVAEHLLKHGHTVIGISRDCTKFTRPMPGFSAVQMDLSQLHELPKKLHDLQHNFPDINAVVFCAGVGQFGSIEEFS
ncbi:MAG: SDR family NAD(P)-dependent oxidoreductase, partial [Methylococcaceae bacterium]